MMYQYKETPKDNFGDEEALGAMEIEKPVGMIEPWLGPTNGKSHLVFGCCCDSRRAVIRMNWISVKIDLILGILFLKEVDVIDKDSIMNALDDDDGALKDMDDETFHNVMVVAVGMLEIIMLCGIIFHSIGLYGAIKFKRWAVTIAALSYALLFITGVFTFNVFPAIIGGLFLYPHVVFLDEMKKGIMTEENYPNVATRCGFLA